MVADKVSSYPKPITSQVNQKNHLTTNLSIFKILKPRCPTTSRQYKNKANIISVSPCCTTNKNKIAAQPAPTPGALLRLSRCPLPVPIRASQSLMLP